MFQKIKVNGDQTHSIYKYLKYNSKELNKSKGLLNIPWNFSKILVDRDGNVVKVYEPGIKPKSILIDIEKLL